MARELGPAGRSARSEAAATTRYLGEGFGAGMTRELGPAGRSKRAEAGGGEAGNRVNMEKGLKQRGPNGECQHCGVRDYRKYAKGLCMPCYQKEYYRKHGC